MLENPSNRPEPEELKKLQLQQQAPIRKFLRTVGPLVFVAGLICTITAFVSFFRAFGGFEPPRLIWLAFIGMPLMFAGGVMSQFGFMGAVARYMAGETAPVATDTAKYVAEETQGAVETVAKAAAKGIVEGIEAGRTKPGEGKD